MPPRKHPLYSKIRQRLPRAVPLPARVRWEGAQNNWEAEVALLKWGRQLLRGRAGSWLLVIGDDSPLRNAVLRRLTEAGMAHQCCETGGFDAFIEGALASNPQLAGVLCTQSDVAGIMAAAEKALRYPGTSQVAFEYVSGLSDEQQQFEAQDEYADTWFVSPVLRDAPNPYEIYAESLRHFEQKCGLRDYLDLYQALAHIAHNDLPGDIAEFGSYRGHSGYLIARTLRAMGCEKAVYLFDMFEEFPTEDVGVDHFWNDSHSVDFAEVSGKFTDLPEVTLVQGDFTETLATTPIKQLALAYIDCDSYRATQQMIEQIWEPLLVSRGLLICEDYGHPALLGNRLAVHEALDQRKDALRFFSQFSGLYITTKY